MIDKGSMPRTGQRPDGQLVADVIGQEIGAGEGDFRVFAGRQAVVIGRWRQERGRIDGLVVEAQEFHTGNAVRAAGADGIGNRQGETGGLDVVVSEIPTEYRYVRAVATVKEVVTATADKGVVAAGSNELIIAAHAMEHVVDHIAGKDVGAVTAVYVLDDRSIGDGEGIAPESAGGTGGQIEFEIAGDGGQIEGVHSAIIAEGLAVRFGAMARPLVGVDVDVVVVDLIAVEGQLPIVQNT